MFFFPRSLTLGVSLLLSTFLIPLSVNAAPLCEYSSYSTPALHHKILEALGNRGFAVAPSAYFSTSDADAPGMKEEFWVLSEGQLYAKLSFNQDAVGASSEIKLNSPEGRLLAESKSTVLPCAGGWCRATTLKTAVDIISGSANGSAGLEISQEPSYGMRYAVYGDEIGVTSWRTQFTDRYEWILKVLTDEEQAVALEPLTRLQQFMFAMASKSELTPFLNELTINIARDGHFIVRGRITHAAYNSMIDAAFENGFYNIEPLVVIDSAAGESYYSDREIGRCLGQQ
jgi:hypothetical protein